MADPRFTDEDTWAGGNFELAIIFDRSAGKQQLAVAAEAAWGAPGLTGPFDDWTIPPGAQRRVSPGLAVDRHLWGLATLPDGTELPFESFGTISARDGHWLCLSFPFGALERMYKLTFDLDESWESWARPLEEWFANMARTIYRKVRFDLALIGEEVFGMEHLESFFTEPTRRKGIGFLLPEDGDVRWYAATEW